MSSDSTSMIKNFVECFLDGQSMKRKFQAIEREIIIEALRRAECNKTKAAKICGLQRTNVVMKMKLYGITTDKKNKTVQG